MLNNSGINSIFLVGYIAEDPLPDIIITQPIILRFAIVTTETLNKKGVKGEHLEYHQILFAQAPGKPELNLKRGQLVYIEGKIATRIYFDEHGIKRYKTEINATNVQKLISGT